MFILLFWSNIFRVFSLYSVNSCVLKCALLVCSFPQVQHWSSRDLWWLPCTKTPLRHSIWTRLSFPWKPQLVLSAKVWQLGRPWGVRGPVEDIDRLDSLATDARWLRGRGEGEGQRLITPHGVLYQQYILCTQLYYLTYYHACCFIYCWCILLQSSNANLFDHFVLYARNPT